MVGLLILLIALTLIVLKLGFLLLLVAGPFFLIVGIHPGFGRVIAIRWFEMLVGVLMKQAAITVVPSVLLYCYSLIMRTADTVLPWALKILMIALVWPRSATGSPCRRWTTRTARPRPPRPRRPLRRRRREPRPPRAPRRLP